MIEIPDIFKKYEKVNKRQDVIELREHILNSFKDLQFIEESHQYFLNGKELTSVSKIVETFVPKTDWNLKAAECSIKYWDNPNSKYYRKTKEEILKAWDDNNKRACDLGHTKHDYGENLFYLYTQQYDRIKGGIEDLCKEPGFEDYMSRNVYHFWQNLPQEYIPILCETRVYSEKYRYAGTFDIMFAWDNGKSLKENILIKDYKTNGDLFKNFNGNRMLEPFESMFDMPISHYEIQLPLYQIPLEDVGLNIIDRRLIYLNNIESYEFYRLKDYTNVLRNIL